MLSLTTLVAVPVYARSMNQERDRQQAGGSGPLLGPNTIYLGPIHPNAYGPGINADAAVVRSSGNRKEPCQAFPILGYRSNRMRMGWESMPINTEESFNLCARLVKLCAKPGASRGFARPYRNRARRSYENEY